MRYKAIIFDLDNTIYPVQSIADELFRSLFQLLEDGSEVNENLVIVKEEVSRKPFQWVAARYGFSDSLKEKAMLLLKNLSIPDTIRPFEDFKETKNLPVEKFLVTTGFTRLQLSKIQKMGIEKEFREVFVVDPELTDRTKKDIFAEILEKYFFQNSDVLVVGDDPESELAAAKDLRLDAVLYDKINRHPGYTAFPRITHFSELQEFVKNPL